MKMELSASRDEIKCFPSRSNGSNEIDGRPRSIVDKQSSHNSQVNPWEQEDPLVSSSRDALNLAESLGLKTKIDDDGDLQEKLEALPTNKLIKLRKEIAAKQDKVNKLKLEVSRLKQRKELPTFMQTSEVEQFINKVKDLSYELDSILKHKDELIDRLQKPFAGEHIKMEAQYHKNVQPTLRKLMLMMNELSVNLDSLSWLSRDKLSTLNQSTETDEVQNLTASLTTNFQTVLQMMKGLEKLERERYLVNSADAR